MQTVPFISGLEALADHYDALICDVWGVLHNGVIGYSDAGDALRRFRQMRGGAVVLLTNAPRPEGEIVRLLDRFAIPRAAYDCIVSSGDVTRELLARQEGKRAYHIGPDRDLPIFAGAGLTKGDPAEAEIVVCTGLFDDDTETPDDYRERLAALAARRVTLICANPDIVVERGHRLIYCAGALAQLYEELGGPVVMIGKPHKKVYDVALDQVAQSLGRSVDKARVLAIGDALPTDVKGARGQGLDVLMVTAGIHAADFGPPDQPDPDKLAKRLGIEGVKIKAAIPRLKW